MKTPSNRKLLKTSALSIVALNIASSLGQGNEVLETLLIIATAAYLYKAFEEQGRKNRPGANVATGIKVKAIKALGIETNTDFKWDNHYRNLINGGADYFDGIMQTTFDAFASLEILERWNAYSDLSDLRDRLKSFGEYQRQIPRAMFLFGDRIHSYKQSVRVYPYPVASMMKTLDSDIDPRQKITEIKKIAKSALNNHKFPMPKNIQQLCIDIGENHFATAKKRAQRANQPPMFEDRPVR